MKRSILAAAITAASLTALAATADETQAAAAQPTGPDTCVFSRTINDWKLIDESHLAVWAPTRRNAYVVELAFPVHGLKFEHSLGFEDRNNDGQFCSYGGDAIIVAGPIRERVLVRSVRRSSAEEIQQLIAAAKERREAPRGEAQGKLAERSDMKSDKDTREPAAQPQDEEPAQDQEPPRDPG